ncbi:MAG: hypothetical protein D6780_00835 [Candidatus Dadabacteria bacterium]|nr:MAG: hypothetical protein D6780_00835 [Candidatus Dadabacteria bacterium]
MYLTGAIIAIILAAGLSYFGYTFVRKQGVSSGEQERQELIDKITALDNRLRELIQYKDSYLSKEQFLFLSEKAKALTEQLELEKKKLKELEEKLAKAQKSVEEKEAEQQELKTISPELEIKVEEWLTKTKNRSSELESFEQEVARVMGEFDKVKGEAGSVGDAEAVFETISETLSQAGELMRNLIIEYQSLRERLELLVEQQKDLEEEYTNLVEKHLGG